MQLHYDEQRQTFPVMVDAMIYPKLLGPVQGACIATVSAFLSQQPSRIRE
ncbi:hypothetical protein G7009_02625 [Pseudomonas capeferrum]|nr:hypothetical protein [Pseudomonas capeferrum]MBA1200685.1 hypothetical protein [Pseudomonas capeferrum]